MSDDKRPGFSVAPGTLTALGNAGSSNTDHDVEKLSLTGDLSQMGTMGRRLSEAGFDVRHSDVYPVIQGREEIVRALQYLWDREIKGWWNQNSAFEKYGIATNEEYRTKLNRYCERTKN